MAALSRRENIISLAEVRAERHTPVPVSLEIDWNQIHAEEEPWEIGRTMWFALVVSTALWAVIAGMIWFV